MITRLSYKAPINITLVILARGLLSNKILESVTSPALKKKKEEPEAPASGSKPPLLSKRVGQRLHLPSTSIYTMGRPLRCLKAQCCHLILNN